MAARWYVLHVYSGSEKKVAEAIRENAERKGMTASFEQVLVPVESVVEVRRGSKVNSERKFFPGYVLVKMDMTDETWHLVKSTPKVTGFLGSRGRPTPISEAEAQRIMHQVDEGVERPKSSVTYEVGEQVPRQKPALPPAEKEGDGHPRGEGEGAQKPEQGGSALRKCSVLPAHADWSPDCLPPHRRSWTPFRKTEPSHPRLHRFFPPHFFLLLWQVLRLSQSPWRKKVYGE